MHLPLPVVRALCGPSYRLSLHGRLPVQWQRRLSEASAAMLRPPRDVRTDAVTLGGRPALRSTPPGAPARDAVLYLHGGGYVVGSARMYRALTGFLARRAGTVVWSLDYRLAPEHPYPAAVDDAVAAFRALVTEHGVPADRIVIAGDSAGGGLAVATALRLADDANGGLRPAALALLSPWLDPADRIARPRDFVVNTVWSKACAQMYRGDADPRDPGFAPMHAELAGLPPTLVHIGRSELLYDQVGRFTARLRTAGVDSTVVEHPVLWHSGHVLAGMLREATAAVDELGDWIRERLDKRAA